MLLNSYVDLLAYLKRPQHIYYLLYMSVCVPIILLHLVRCSEIMQLCRH